MMKRFALTLLLIVALTLSAAAQVTDYIRPWGALPPTCNPRRGNVAFLTAGIIGIYACTNWNTWTLVSGMGGIYLAGAGSVLTPSYSFVGDDDTGMYHPAPNQVAISSGNTMTGFFTQNGFYTRQGTAALPGVSFVNDGTTGMYMTGAAQLGFSVGGVLKTTIDANRVLTSAGVMLEMTGLAFAALGAPVNGSFVYCSDCTIAGPCAGGGTGALAKRLNGVWVCN